MSIKTLIVIAVTSLDLSVMSWSPWPNQLVLDSLLLTVKIERMDPIGLTEMREFNAVVGLNGLGLVAEMTDGHFYKLDGRIGRLFTERVNEAFSAGFIDDSVLKESIRHFTHVTSFGNIFDIELPLHAECFRGMVRLWNIWLFLQGFLLVKALFPKKTKK